MIDASNLDLVVRTKDGPARALSNAGQTVAPGDFVSFNGLSGRANATFLHKRPKPEHRHAN